MKFARVYPLALLTFAAALAAGCGGGRVTDLPHVAQTGTANSRSPHTFAIPPMAGLDGSSRRVMSLRKPKSDIQALGFSQLPGAAVFIAASPDGTFWVLSPNGLPSGDKFIYHYVNGTFVNVPGAATRLAVGPDNTVWALNAAGGIYHLNNGRFLGIGGGASEISIAADNSAYVVSNQPGGAYGRGLYRYANGAWAQLPGAGVTVSASIDSGTYEGGIIAPGGFYVTNSAGSIFYYNLATGFTQLPGAAISLAPTASGGIFALGDPGAIQHGIYYNDLNVGQWKQMPGAAVGIATAGSNVFALGAAGGIYVSPILPAQTNPTFANTANPTYFPMAYGNRWIFNSGGEMDDIGTVNLSCSCAINGNVLEGVDLITPTGAYSGTFYLKKVARTSLQTLLVGTSMDHGVSISLLTDGSVYGIVTMDDAAFVGETSVLGGEFSTITAVNQIQPYVGGQLFDLVNTDQLSGAVALSWNFAQGVGPTSLTYNGQTTTLAAFAIDVVNSQGSRRKAQSIHVLKTVRADANTVNPAAGLFR